MRICSVALVIIVLESCRPAPPPTTEVTANVTRTDAIERRVVTRPDSVIITYLVESRRFVAWSSQGGVLWWLTMPNDEVLVGQPAVAANSNLYVRANKSLIAFSPQGEILWTKELPMATADAQIMTPTTLNNSGVVLATSPREVVAFDPTGSKMWEFTLPGSTTMLSAPVNNPNGTIAIATEQALLGLTGDGAMLWYRGLDIRPEQAQPKP
jgi:outer membrane protein assembly factor BamB